MTLWVLERESIETDLEQKLHLLGFQQSAGCILSDYRQIGVRGTLYSSRNDILDCVDVSA